jgi:YcxB-like protein
MIQSEPIVLQNVGEAGIAMSNDRTIVGNTEIILADQMRAIFWSAPRRFCIGGAVVVVALLVIGGLAAYVEDVEGVAVIIAVVCLLCWPIHVVLSFRRLGKEQRLVSYEISSDQITVRDATGAAVIQPWKIVRRVLESRSGFAIRVMPGGTRWIPKRAFAADAIPRLRELIESKMAERRAPAGGAIDRSG